MIALSKLEENINRLQGRRDARANRRYMHWQRVFKSRTGAFFYSVRAKTWTVELKPLPSDISVQNFCDFRDGLISRMLGEKP